MDIEIYVDGGCKGNGGPDPKGYGSFAVKHEGEIKRHETFNLNAKTNNEAEYNALSRALVSLNSLYARAPRVKGAKVIIYTDSQLVVGQLTLGWKLKADNLVEPHQRASNQLITLKKKYLLSLVKVPREQIVAVLGH